MVGNAGCAQTQCLLAGHSSELKAQTQASAYSWVCRMYGMVHVPQRLFRAMTVSHRAGGPSEEPPGPLSVFSRAWTSLAQTTKIFSCGLQMPEDGRGGRPGTKHSRRGRFLAVWLRVSLPEYLSTSCVRCLTWWLTYECRSLIWKPPPHYGIYMCRSHRSNRAPAHRDAQTSVFQVT